MIYYLDSVLKFGINKDVSLRNLLFGINENEEAALVCAYLNDMISFFTDTRFKSSIIIPRSVNLKRYNIAYTDYSSSGKDLKFSVSQHSIMISSNEERITKNLTSFLHSVLSLNFKNLKRYDILKKKSAEEDSISLNSLMMFPDKDYIEWSINNLDSFILSPNIYDYDCSKDFEFSQRYLENFNSKIIDNSRIHFEPSFSSRSVNISAKVLTMNHEKGNY